jgi:hypothetical protein
MVKVMKGGYEAMQKKLNRKNILLVGIFLILSLAIVSASNETYIVAGNCVNFTYQEGTYNATTNLTMIKNVTKVFCGTDNSTNYCSINKTLAPGEKFSKVDSACNVNIEATIDTKLFEHEVPIMIEADNSWIRVTVDSDTKSYPRDSTSFQYSANQVIKCPYVEDPGNETLSPKTLDSCLDILSRTTGLTADERVAYTLCQTERDNYKVEWEKRGTEIDTLNQKVATGTSEKENCEKKVSSEDATNWIMMILLFVCLIVILAFFVKHLKERNGDAKKME